MPSSRLASDAYDAYFAKFNVFKIARRVKPSDFKCYLCSQVLLVGFTTKFMFPLFFLYLLSR